MKTVVMLGAVVLASAVFAGPHGHGPRPGGHFGHRPPPVIHHHSGWGHGGRNFWPGFVGGVVGGIVGSAVVSQPVVVTTPTVVTTPVVTTPVVVQQPVVTAPVVAAPVTTVQNVWVEGRYVDQVQANGTVIRVWQPGHYEARTVTVQ